MLWNEKTQKFQAFASVEEILEVKTSNSRIPFNITEGAAFTKFAAISDDEKITEGDGYVYVRCRAISSRVNKNNDGWPSDELTKAYKSFIGRPIFVDHNNDNPDRTRGVIIDSRLHVEDEKKSGLDPYYATAPDNHKPPTWIELLLEVDGKTFPKLADGIRKNHIDAVSMGANIERSICSVCGNEAINPAEYCSHVERKGAEFEVESAEGKKIRKKAYEDCYGVNFFEISFVFDPADETALISEKRGANEQLLIPSEQGGQWPMCAVCNSEVTDEGRLTHSRDWGHDFIPQEESGDRGYYDRSTGQQIAKVAGGVFDQEDNDDDSFADYLEEGEGYAVDPANQHNEAEQVLHWRIDQLVQLGFSEEQALQLAQRIPNNLDPGVDLGDMRKYINQGATPEQLYPAFSRFGEEADQLSLGQYALDPRQSQAGRDWLADLQWENMDPEDFANLPDEVVAKAIQKFYDGGIDQFVRDSRFSSVAKDSPIYKHLIKKALESYTNAYMQFTGSEEDRGDKAWIAAKNSVDQAGFDDLAFELAHNAKSRFEQAQYIMARTKKSLSEREINYEPQGDKVTAPQEVDTLRRDYQCPNCKSDNLITDSDGVMRCPTCDYSQPPKGLDNPDLSQHKDLQDEEAEPEAQPQDPLDQIKIRPRQEGELHPDNPIISKNTTGEISRMNWKTVFDGATVEIPLTHPNGITLETYTALKDAGLSAKVTYPGGESTEIPSGNPVRDIMLVAQYQKQAGLKNASDLIVTVSAPSDEIEQVLEIIQSGGNTAAVSPKKIVINPSSGPKSDAPQNPKIVSDQMKPVTSETKEAEIITIELQPKAEEEVVVNQEEKEDEEPEVEEEDKEAKLLAAFTLADELVEQGVVASKDKLSVVAYLEQESLAQIESRKHTVELFKAAGVRKQAKVALPRIPRLASFQTESSTDPSLDAIPDEAIFS